MGVVKVTHFSQVNIEKNTMSQSTLCSVKIWDSEISTKTIVFSFCFYKIKYIIIQIKLIIIICSRVIILQFGTVWSNILNLLVVLFKLKKLNRLVDIVVQFCAPFGQFFRPLQVPSSLSLH